MDSYNAAKLDTELKAAGLPVVGCSSTGRIDWQEGHPTAEEEQAAAAVLAAHDPAPVDPKAELAAEIQQATTMDELRAVLLKLLAA